MVVEQVTRWYALQAAVAMIGALRDAMAERGLGTPATRAATIEGLIMHKYVLRGEINKRDLHVSNKGMAGKDK